MPGLSPRLTAADTIAGITGVHPLAELFPPLTTDEYDALSADVRRNGLQYAIVIDRDGLILDGLHRRRACLENQVPLKVVQTARDPAKAVLSLNLTRRFLSESQRAMIGVVLYYTNKENGSGTRIDSIAEVVGVSSRTMQRAKRVYDDKTRPGAGLSAQVREGKVSLKDADAQIARMRRPPRASQSPQERAAARAAKQAEAKRHAEIAVRVQAHSVEGLARSHEDDRSLDIPVTPFILMRRTESEDDEPATQPVTPQVEATPEPEPEPESTSATFEDFKRVTVRVTAADEFDLCRRWFLTHMTERPASSPP